MREIDFEGQKEIVRIRIYGISLGGKGILVWILTTWGTRRVPQASSLPFLGPISEEYTHPRAVEKIIKDETYKALSTYLTRAQ